jgi:alpha-tubulin suppressor-like RCC1 family protein
MGSSGQNGNNVETQTRSSPTQVGTDENWAMVSIGPAHTLGVKSDGTAWTWGFGDDGALGQDIGNARRSSPTQVGTDTNWSDYITVGEYWNVAIKTNGTLWSWGAGQSGRPLGQNESSVLGYSSPKQVGTDTTWAKMHTSSTNGYQMYCIKTDNTMWVWGQNHRGLLGLNQTDNLQLSSPTQLGTGTNWNEVSSGGYNQAVLATKSDGTLWAWGDNAHAQCGQNMTTSGFSSPVQVGSGTDWSQGRGDRAFATGGDMSVAAKTDGTLWFWGDNSAGQGGQNLTTPGRSSPIQISGTSWSGGNAMGTGNDASMYFFSKSTN